LKSRLGKNAINIWTLKRILPYWASYVGASQTTRWQEKNNEAVFNATFKPKCREAGATSEGEDMDGLKMGDEQHNHYYPQPAAPQAQPSALSKLAGPLLIGASILGTGGIGTAGYVAVQAIDKIATMQQGKVQDGKMEVEFIGGTDATETTE